MFVPNLAALMVFSDKLPDSAELKELVDFVKGLTDAVTWPRDDDPLPFASEAYLTRFRQKMIDSGKFSSDEVNTIMKHARGYAGGTAQRKPVEPEPLAAQEGFFQHSSVIDIASLQMAEGDTFTPWMQITPVAGSSFKHPRYGDVKFDKTFADQMVSSFKNNVYQEHIPIDAEHETKVSGALGYYRELRTRPDGAVEARIELTDRGRTLRQQGGFKYFSPEFFRTWTDPATSKTFNNILVGGAFTSRPFFKDQHLAPLAASEQYNVIKGGPTVTRWQMNEDGTFKLDAEGNPILTAEAAKADEDTQKAAVATTEAAALKAFREAHNLDEDGKPIVAKPNAFAEQYPEEARRMAEAEAVASRLTGESQRRKFSDTVRGIGGAGDGARPFTGKSEDHVNHMVSLAEKFGEDSSELAFYVANQREHAEQIHKAGLFSEKGSSGGAKPQEPEAEAEKQANALMAADPKLSMGEAMDRVLQAHPELYSDSLKD